MQLRSCLEKGAKDCARADSVLMINRLLLAAYGISSSEARNTVHDLTREPSFGARVERLARIGYGGIGRDTKNSMAVEHFECSVIDPALRQHLLLVDTFT